VLEALLLTTVTAQAVPLSEARKVASPSLELLEFLGEFGDDEEGLFEGEPGPEGKRAPAKDARAGNVRESAKPAPAPPATKPPAAKEKP
jgi:hypothetical protein